MGVEVEVGKRKEYNIKPDTSSMIGVTTFALIRGIK
jgi:hypothetical protein